VALVCVGFLSNHRFITVDTNADPKSFSAHILSVVGNFTRCIHA
jgi:hypothetical protein